MDTPHAGDQHIVVGVDGSDGSAAAIRYGADRAYESGRGLHLVHVAPVFIPLSGAVPLGTPYMPQDFDSIGQAVLGESVEYAKALMPEDAKEAIGHGIRAKRSKSGAVSFDVLSMEGSHAPLQ